MRRISAINGSYVPARFESTTLQPVELERTSDVPPPPLIRYSPAFTSSVLKTGPSAGSGGFAGSAAGNYDECRRNGLAHRTSDGIAHARDGAVAPGRLAHTTQGMSRVMTR